MQALPPTRRAAPLTHVSDAAEGADPLAEVPGAQGVLLWSALRDLMLWAETPAGRRAALFGDQGGRVRRAQLSAWQPEQELWGPLLTLAQMADAPEDADRARLVFAARSVARWAERRAAPGTRLAFTRAAAVALPEDPRLALETARIARDLGRTAEAEAWFRHTVRRSRGNAWESYVWAFIGLGVMYVRAGNYPAAQSVFGRALRCARKRRMRALEASSLHHLFTCAAEGRDVALAYAYARAALEAYGTRHPRIPQLAGDLARFWMYLGQHARALPVFEAVEPLIPDLSERMITAANAARAAARAGHLARYAAARDRVAAMVAENVAGTRVADAWLIVAWADADAGRWAEAADAASRAVQLARTRDESEILVQAEAQLEALLARRIPSEGRSVAETPASERDGAVLADELLVRIAELQPA
jgi:tetratricopeptide (TPR) repeat protein